MRISKLFDWCAKMSWMAQMCFGDLPNGRQTYTKRHVENVV